MYIGCSQDRAIPARVQNVGAIPKDAGYIY